MKPIFKVGFELEGCLHEPNGLRSNLEFWQSLQSIKNCKSICPGYDNHNCPTQHYPAEIRTPAFSLENGKAALEDILDSLLHWTELGDWLTTSGCGLHMSISEVRTMKSRRDVERYRFFTNFVQYYPEWEILQLFHRQNNYYCKPWFDAVVEVRDRLPRFDKIMSGYHYSVQSHLSGVRPPYRHLECRGQGGENYHTRFDAVFRAFDAMVETAERAFELTLTDTRLMEELFH